MAAHAAPCRAVGVSFIPLAIESLGGWGELAAILVVLWARDWACPPPLPLASFSKCAQCHCGEGMLPCGHITSLQSPRILIVLSDSMFFVCFLFCVVLSFVVVCLFWFFGCFLFFALFCFVFVCLFLCKIIVSGIYSHIKTTTKSEIKILHVYTIVWHTYTRTTV